MNNIKIVNKKNEVLASFESSYCPQEGEAVWLDQRINSAQYVTIQSKVLDFDAYRKRLNITLIAE